MKTTTIHQQAYKSAYKIQIQAKHLRIKYYLYRDSLSLKSLYFLCHYVLSVKLFVFYKIQQKQEGDKINSF